MGLGAAPGSLAVYKQKPALVTALGSKVTIRTAQGETINVREKDIIVIYPGPVKDLRFFNEGDAAGDAAGAVAGAAALKEAWALLKDDGTAITLKDLAELCAPAWTPASAWQAWQALSEGVYFCGTPDAITCRPEDEVLAAEKRRAEKARESGQREAALALARGGGVLSKDESDTLRGALQDIEALALGASEKSRSLRDLGHSESPEEAHRVLLSLGLWDAFRNPHPSRCGVSLAIPSAPVPAPQAEPRVDLRHLPAFAIDNAWSGDPDDAVSLECGAEGRLVLWVHVADPAQVILPDTEACAEARARGTSLYLPEGTIPMLPPACVPLFGLGLAETSPALSFRLSLNEDATIAETDVLLSTVRVTRLDYAAADALIAGGEGPLPRLAALAARNIERRLDTGAVLIDFPDAHIFVKERAVHIEPIPAYRSAEMVRECMVLAGEGAAQWALRRGLAFPFAGQEAGELPEKRLPGLAGAYLMRRAMRPRVVSMRPAVHWGLGLDAYSQVTSPLRRYGDLFCHQQLRAVLRGGEPLSEEAALPLLAAADAAAAAAAKAERASRLFWTCVYLSDKIGTAWEGVILDRKPRGEAAVCIPALGLETLAAVPGEPNEPVRLTLRGVDIPGSGILFG
ncbi:MAG: RNB domain-containing ribonuclease [Treponema sp.]|jgi:exoribonuclease-2|nr:RNB domain-containing ribonuclease [Treponema sp.]